MDFFSLMACRIRVLDSSNSGASRIVICLALLGVMMSKPGR